jgi:hypothetical protein
MLPAGTAAAFPNRQRELCFDGFAVLYSGESKRPIYAVERLNKDGLELPAQTCRPAGTLKLNTAFRLLLHTVRLEGLPLECAGE